MPPVVIVVPAEQVLPVLDGLLALYDTKVDTVSHRVREYLAEEVPSAVLLREREALARIDAAIEQIGWARMPRLVDASIETELEIIAAAAHNVLAIRANQLDIICEEHELPEGDLAPISRAIAEVIDAHRLLVSVEHAAAGHAHEDAEPTA